MEDNIHEKTFGVNRLSKRAKELTNQSYLVNLRRVICHRLLIELFSFISSAGGKRLRRKASRFQTILLIITGCFLLSSCSGGKKETPVAALPVEVAPVAQKKVPIQLKVIGNVQAYSTVSLKSRIAGQIIRVYFKEGDDVKKGDLLFMIDPRPLEAAVKQSEANLERDMAQVKQAEANLERD